MKRFKFGRGERKKHIYGVDDIVSVSKTLKSMNYRPVEYMLSKDFAEFLRTVKKELFKKVQKINLDDLNDDTLDYYIDSKIDYMKRIAQEQYTHHLNLIKFNQAIVEGEISEAQEHQKNLKDDLKCIEDEIQVYKEIQKREKIF